MKGIHCLRQNKRDAQVFHLHGSCNTGFHIFCNRNNRNVYVLHTQGFQNSRLAHICTNCISDSICNFLNIFIFIINCQNIIICIRKLFCQGHSKLPQSNDCKGFSAHSNLL